MMNDMLAFPWECIGCGEQNRGEPAHRHSWGRICARCWETAKQRSFEEVTAQ